MSNLKRMWINAPSTRQPVHKLHGVNVLADWTNEHETVTVYFLNGPVISQLVPRIYLESGWLIRDTPIVKALNR